MLKLIYQLKVSALQDICAQENSEQGIIQITTQNGLAYKLQPNIFSISPERCPRSFLFFIKVFFFSQKYPLILGTILCDLE